jgi:hypothetical protein
MEITEIGHQEWVEQKLTLPVHNPVLGLTREQTFGNLPPFTESYCPVHLN